MELPEGEAVRQVFTGADIQQLKKLAELYIQAKGLILYSEEIDPESRSNLQVIKELRDANDHLMRVVVARLADNLPSGINDAQSYCHSNLDKAIGHVYRAAFDALDGTILSLREKVAKILDAYPQEVINRVSRCAGRAPPGYGDLRFAGVRARRGDATPLVAFVPRARSSKTLCGGGGR